MDKMMVRIDVVESHWYMVNADDEKGAVREGIGAWQGDFDNKCVHRATDMQVYVNGKLHEAE